jgi:ssDNA-binding Zn-finger/Zn-ribbon topoisomerase 1
MNKKCFLRKINKPCKHCQKIGLLVMKRKKYGTMFTGLCENCYNKIEDKRKVVRIMNKIEEEM